MLHRFYIFQRKGLRLRFLRLSVFFYFATIHLREVSHQYQWLVTGVIFQIQTMKQVRQDKLIEERSVLKMLNQISLIKYILWITTVEIQQQTILPCQADLWVTPLEGIPDQKTLTTRQMSPSLWRYICTVSLLKVNWQLWNNYDNIISLFVSFQRSQDLLRVQMGLRLL